MAQTRISRAALLDMLSLTNESYDIVRGSSPISFKHLLFYVFPSDLSPNMIYFGQKMKIEFFYI